MRPRIKIGLLLHFYQPWWQFRDVLDRIVDECYRPVFNWLDSFPRFAFSANINWSLLELLSRDGHDDVIALIRNAVDRRRLELFGTAAHHPIVPLMTDIETERQIVRDGRGKLGLGLPASNCAGFYLPEYAFSRDVVRPIKRAGYRFTVADDAAFAAQHGYVPFDHLPVVQGLAVFLRSRRWGNVMSWGRYDFDRFSREFIQGVGNWFGGRSGYVVLATDAETFGHHHRTLFDRLLKPMIENWHGDGSPVDIMPFQRLLDVYGQNSRDIAVPPSTWSTEPGDFVTGNHFPLWNSPDNIYHQALWRLVDVARRYGDAPGLEEDVLKMLSSCCWWQVSGRPSFNPRLMMPGARKALEIIEKAADEGARQEGRQAYETLVRLPGINR